VQLKPTGSITISNAFGHKVATIPIDEQNVLPGAIRKVNANWKTKWLFGKYHATLSVVYGKDRQVLTASTAFWGFPYKLVGLVLVIRTCASLSRSTVAIAVAAYITAAYWFTSSTSFANPAVTGARALSDTFTGIRPVDVPLFIMAQLIGALAATLLARWLLNAEPTKEIQ